MPSPVRARHLAAFTRKEMVVLFAGIALLCSLAFPILRTAKASAAVGQCSNQQKAMWAGLQRFAMDDTVKVDAFPTSISVASLASTQGPADSPLLLYFHAAAKQIEAPVSLWCPGESREKLTTNWTTLSRSNFSYFLSLDAQPNSPEMVLLGDKHLETELPRSGSRLELTRSSVVRWGRAPHDGIGQFALADGSVQRSHTNLVEFITPSLAPPQPTASNSHELPNGAIAAASRAPFGVR